MIRTISTMALFAVGATVAFAQTTGGKAIEERKALMKEVNAQTRTVSNMTKGTEPFDLAKAQRWLAVSIANVAKSKSLFPDDSKEGGDTRATAAIWTNRADYNAKNEQFVAVAKAAQAAVKDEASLKSEFAKVGASCDACHKDYRAPSKR